ncbi:beta-ketodecanoyl-[acyl-carrier-protein] synthase [Litorimonas taeanensis]|uniref:Beta-ketodecanoyl-[acyl-carrier-protein] synthase n=1 Tax=Litorimonas taeanensis TaxID=568099 RepID=A0A420WIE2_9PROT|nr:beta-ketoacyl-ACP synthase III [Litorimonas taeanensis]RKQ70747.1 beta-ketodecanoyl-[acyl-carrier-protein] synthase [Litorimonas taeanensis]
MKAVISSTGLWTPKDSISNEELVESFNAYVDKWNSENVAEIESGEKLPLTYSNAEFIEKASGVKSRYVISKEPILDPNIMAPRIPARADAEPSILAEIAAYAARQALERANRKPEDVGAVIVACSNLQRGYPAVAVEVQSLLGTSGFAFDMNVACSSATFGIETARGLIIGGQAKSVLVVNPEICTAHLNFKDRDAHFIFGDVATAILVESDDIAPSEHWEIVASKLVTEFSNNIRNNFGFLNHCAPEDNGMTGDRGKKGLTDKLFVQNGRSVFKEVVPMVAKMITAECEANNLDPHELKRMWLHQANLNMNVLIAKKVLGKDVDIEQAPVVLDEYANTSSAGSIIAFHKHSEDFKSGDMGLICSFGAGYSAGAVFIKKVA